MSKIQIQPSWSFVNPGDSLIQSQSHHLASSEHPLHPCAELCSYIQFMMQNRNYHFLQFTHKKKYLTIQMLHLLKTIKFYCTCVFGTSLPILEGEKEKISTVKNKLKHPSAKSTNDEKEAGGVGLSIQN